MTLGNYTPSFSSIAIINVVRVSRLSFPVIVTDHAWLIIASDLISNHMLFCDILKTVMLYFPSELAYLQYRIVNRIYTRSRCIRRIVVFSLHDAMRSPSSKLDWIKQAVTLSAFQWMLYDTLKLIAWANAMLNSWTIHANVIVEMLNNSQAHVAVQQHCQ